MKVCKFGGSSVADAAQIRKVCRIVSADPTRRIVVVSAPGKRHSSDTKVTDLLIACASRRLADEPTSSALAAVVARFAELQSELGLAVELLDTIREDLEARLASDSSHSGRYMDLLKAAGEDNSARVVAAALRADGIDAHYVAPGEAGMILTSEFGNAQLVPSSYEQLAALRDRDGITVFPGFFGRTASGDVATFPRGGSDITGSILAAAVDAERYENFTDVDSVYAVDPRIVPEVTEAIGEITYREMRELSYAGFGVFHDEAIQPAVKAEIPICIMNTNSPERSGTLLVPHHRVTRGRVVGVASDTGFCTLYVSKYLMNREVGFGRRLLQILEEEGLSFEHTPSGIDNMSVILRDVDFAEERAERVKQRIRAELAVDDVSIERGLALVMLVGEGMRYTVGLSARATSALARAGVNIEMINQGSSEISLMFGVKAEDRHHAVRALYKAFFVQTGVSDELEGSA